MGIRVAGALALFASAALLVLPVYTGSGSATLLQVNGAGVLLMLAIPPAITLLPLLVDHRVAWIVSTLVLSAFVLILGFSIGLFYLPSALVLSAACLRRRFS